ncbi:hypothetical protein MTR67_035063 [Solanum verrucosum]|uniref:Reverse transcriptase domain-containing protein n=1 Tax=Solanum verrucosum TaxID=315347 RepID=A0AAF0U8V2_SOLVR|nr:hypothetical protein MTR67_035063 [Solanum verrucosum]
MIHEEENKLLLTPFEQQEILESIKACAGDKAPGPDGYSMAFFCQCWDIIKPDLVATVQQFHKAERFEKSINSTFVALIPKKVGAEELTDFRPISLIGGVYKIIAKLLAERLKKVLHRLVDSQQMAFIKGRQIMDAVLIANECVESRQRSKCPGILCKLDIQKAYDHLNWNFLLLMMQRMGFGAKWIRWVKFCISTVKFSILVNRTPSGFFSSQRGLRQGDPLSPFLFILAMEDDTLIFCEAMTEQMLILRVIFIIFEAVSGLHINWGKSFIYPINEVAQVESLARVLGGRVGELPTIYLSMPLGGKSKSIGIWNGVIEKCEKKLTNWKSQYLSRGGRLTMVNSVLDAIPAYMMFVFPAPDNVIQRIDALRRSFFWQGNEDKKKFHLVKWEEVIKNKKEGGLGIRNMKKQNKSLMLKWLWKFMTGENMLWREVIRAKYEMENRWMTKMVTTPYGCGSWRSIRNLWPLFLSRIRYQVGQGWNLHLRRNLNDWEMGNIVAFHDTMTQFSNLTREEDKVVWKIGSKGVFSVKSAYKDLNQSNSNDRMELWPWRMI